MDEIDFLDSILSYKRIDTARRAKINKEKERKKELSLKKNISKKGNNVEDLRKTKRLCKNNNYRGGHTPGNRVKKFCQYCKDNGGKYWIHNTDEYFVKDGKSKKEANKMEDWLKISKGRLAAIATPIDCNLHLS